MPRSTADLSLKLPHVYAIGFTGQGPVADEAACAAAIGAYLARQMAVAGRTVVGVSTAAEGAPLLFAESCFALEIPLRLLLPSPRESFLAEAGAQAGGRLEQAIERAISVEVAGSEESPGERYYECGLQVVQQSQELLALFDGEASAEMGGPAEIVAFAGEMRRPVTWVHSLTRETKAIDPTAQPDASGDRELNFLNQLPFAGSPAAAALPVPAQWLAKLDANAAELAPQVRKLAALPIVCTALAAFVSAAAQNRHGSTAWIAAGAVLGLAASLLPTALRLAKRQALWVRIRTAAEISRSALALWHTPGRYQVVGPEILAELSGMIRSLDLIKSQERCRTAVDLALFKGEYLEERLHDQMRYFARQSGKSAATGQRFRLVAKVCSIVAIAVSAGNLAERLFIRAPSHRWGSGWLPLLASALFQGATMAGALLVVNECERRERRYREIHRSLAEWEIELRAFHTWPAVIGVVNKIERALLVELLEWRSLLQNMKMPRN
jgi:hypothetical protein